jgi:hypothetical protein
VPLQAIFNKVFLRFNQRIKTIILMMLKLNTKI